MFLGVFFSFSLMDGLINKLLKVKMVNLSGKGFMHVLREIVNYISLELKWNMDNHLKLQRYRCESLGQ